MTGPVQSQYPIFSGTAPDSDSPPIYCTGARRLSLQISNQAVLITFGRGPQGVVRWDTQPEPYLPVVGSVAPPGGFDAFKVRAQTPAAQLPAGATPANATLIPR